MTALRYVLCSVCRCISRLNADEEEICAYCGGNIREGEEVSERQWRRYWIGVVGQYNSLNIITKTKQLVLETATNSRPELIKEGSTRQNGKEKNPER